MADDIDDLLDEVETKFCENNQSNSHQYTTGSSNKRTQNSKNRCSNVVVQNNNYFYCQ